MELMDTYNATVLVFGLTGLLLLVQLLISDFLSIKKGHKPGYQVEESHNNLLFRVSRAFANTNETVAVFILFALFGMLSSANGHWLDLFSVVYLLGRVGHMICYYANLKLARSVLFVLSILALIGMFGTGLKAWL